MMMSMSGFAITSRASDTIFAWSPTTSLARAVSRSATIVISMPRPARRRISSWLRRSTLNVPLPTVPMPSRPTWMGFMVRMASVGSVSMTFSVVFEKARDATDRIGQVIGVRQEHETEVVGLRPVEAGALHDDHFFFGKQFIGELLVVGDGVHLRVELGKHVERGLGLDHAHTRDLRQKVVGQIALPAQPPGGRHQVLDALVAAQRGLNRQLPRRVGAQ